MISLEDVRKTIFKYIQDNWSETTIKFPGVEFDDSAVTQWIHVIAPTLNAQVGRKSDEFSRGLLVIHFFNRFGADLYALDALVDIMEELIMRVDIALVSGAGYIRFEETEKRVLETPLPGTEGIDTCAVRTEFSVQNA